MSSSNSVKSLLANSEQTLKGHSDSAKLDCEILLSFVLSKPKTFLLTWPEHELNDEQLAKFEQLFARRLAGEPVAYLVGEKEFWSLSLKVAPSTLIPRPDTETLVELVLNHHTDDALALLDLGTGTGAIALALASEKPNWLITAVDFQLEAVELAKQNAQLNQLTHVNIFQSDWFSAIQPSDLFDVIVSNPPYIDEADPHLAQGDVRFEPLTALTAKDCGLADIRHIADVARKYLNKGGMLYLEHGYDQGIAVRNILSESGYTHVTTEQDLNGNDRISIGCYQ